MNLALRESWPSQSIGGVPTRVRFTTTQLRKANVIRNPNGVMTGLERSKPRARRKPKSALSDFTISELTAELIRRCKA